MASHKDWSLATRALLRIKTRVLLFNLGPPEPLGQVRISYFGGCQHLWARPLHSHHILLRGYRLLVPSRPGLISYCIQVSTYLIPFTTHAKWALSSQSHMQIRCSHLSYVDSLFKKFLSTYIIHDYESMKPV